MTFNIRYDEPRDKENAWPNRKELVAMITDRTDCKKSTAYAAVDAAKGVTIVEGADGKFAAA